MNANRLFLIGFAMGLSIVSMPAHPGGDVALGQAKTVTCSGCHGSDGMREVPLWQGGNSHLAGMAAQKFTAALNSYRFGQRFHPMMQFFVLPMSDKDVEDMAAYYASLGASAAQH